MTIIPRSDVSPFFNEVLANESHHNHGLIKDHLGIVRWRPNEKLSTYRDKMELPIGYFVEFLTATGYNKNSEVYRKLYRDIGYDLEGYWEVFYCNNDESDSYNQPK